jgi:hypothetical protein
MSVLFKVFQDYQVLAGPALGAGRLLGLVGLALLWVTGPGAFAGSVLVARLGPVEEVLRQLGY